MRNNGFDEVFRQKLNKLQKRIESLLDEPKAKRRKELIKQLIKEAKAIKKALSA